MSTTFYLVRHAKKEKRIGDVSLTPEGRVQAEATARYFRSIQIGKIVSSPLARAMETAGIIAQAANLPVSETIGLRERANWGDVPGQTFEQFVQEWERCTRDRQYSPPGGDSSSAAGERMRSCLSEFAERYPLQTIVAVTHGGLITDFLCSVIPEDKLRGIHPHFIEMQSYLVAECSITKVSCTDGKFDLEEFASVNHLR